jgi:hypothetical protein
VTQRVEAERLLEAGDLERLAQPLVHAAVPERLTGDRVAEDEIVVALMLALLRQPIEVTGDDVGHRDRPLGAPGLRRGERLGFAIPGTANADASVDVVDAVPVERL